MKRLQSLMFVFLTIIGCAPRVIHIAPVEGTPGTTVSLSMEYLVGWPRIEIGGQTMDYNHLELSGLKPESQGVPGEDLTWIEDKIIKFRIPPLPAGEYVGTVHDDKGPPGDPVYSILETTAYMIFPPVWPFVFRSNRTQFALTVLPSQ